MKKRWNNDKSHHSQIKQNKDVNTYAMNMKNIYQRSRSHNAHNTLIEIKHWIDFQLLIAFVNKWIILKGSRVP